VKTGLESVDKFEETEKQMDDKIKAIISDMKLK
jgi:hypothetical protein